MQIVSIGDNLHEMSNHVSWEYNEKNISKYSILDFLQRVLSIKYSDTSGWYPSEREHAESFSFPFSKGAHLRGSEFVFLEYRPFLK